VFHTQNLTAYRKQHTDMLDTALRALTGPASPTKDASVSNEHLQEIARRRRRSRSRWICLALGPWLLACGCCRCCLLLRPVFPLRFFFSLGCFARFLIDFFGVYGTRSSKTRLKKSRKFSTAAKNIATY
jgi:hypothetical protein